MKIRTPDYVFAFSDGRIYEDGYFQPESSNAFYLNVERGVGVNMEADCQAGLYSSGLVSM